MAGQIFFLFLGFLAASTGLDSLLPVSKQNGLRGMSVDYPHTIDPFHWLDNPLGQCDLDERSRLCRLWSPVINSSFETPAMSIVTSSPQQLAIVPVSEPGQGSKVFNLQHLIDLYNPLGKAPRQRKMIDIRGNWSNIVAPAPELRINVASVVCGNGANLDEAKMQIKSLVMFSWETQLNVILFGDEDAFTLLLPWLLELKKSVEGLHKGFTYELYATTFPDDNNEDNSWRGLFAPCASQRLFFPTLLPHIDALIYLDTDTILVSNLTTFWLELSKMTEDQVVGMTRHNELPSSGYYSKNQHIPYFGERGLQSGVQLMNLTRMRSFNYVTRVQGAYEVYKERLMSHDQDLVNILLHAHPHRAYVLNCTFNFFDLHCGETPKRCHDEPEDGPRCFCHQALDHGIHVVQGTGDLFLRDYPELIMKVGGEHSAKIFRMLYQNFEQFNLTHGSTSKLVESLVKGYNSLGRPCFDMTGEQMYANVRKYFQNLSR